MNLWNWLNGPVAGWNAPRGRIVLLIAVLFGIAACVLGNSIVKADPPRYQYARFVADPNTVDVWWGPQGENHQAVFFVAESGRCFYVQWPNGTDGPYVARTAWGYSIRAADGHGITHTNCNEPQPDSVCYSDKHLACVAWTDCENDWPCTTTCAAWGCVSGGTWAHEWCDSAEESSGGGSSSMDAGADCD